MKVPLDIKFNSCEQHWFTRVEFNTKPQKREGGDECRCMDYTLEGRESGGGGGDGTKTEHRQLFWPDTPGDC